MKAWSIFNPQNEPLLHTIRETKEECLEAFDFNIIIYTAKQMFEEKGYKIRIIELKF